MEALGLELAGHRQVIVQGKSSTKKQERGHTQQTLNSSGTLEHSKHVPFCNTCLTKNNRSPLSSGQVRSEIDAILVD